MANLETNKKPPRNYGDVILTTRPDSTLDAEGTEFTISWASVGPVSTKDARAFADALLAAIDRIKHEEDADPALRP